MLVFTITTSGASEINWSLFPLQGAPSVTIFWETNNSTGAITDASLIRGLALLCALQALITIDLYCVELLVDCSRDKSIWRAAGKPSGLKRDSNTLMQTLSSWQTLLILVYKPIMHWIYGLCVSAWFYSGIHIEPAQIFYMTVLAVILTILTTRIANYKPHGPQPAMYGHLQTIVNLVGRWPA